MTGGLVSLVFSLEKLWYTIHYVVFWINREGKVKDFLGEDWAYIFFLGYGVGDFLFGLFFLKVFYDGRKGKYKITEKDKGP